MGLEVGRVLGRGLMETDERLGTRVGDAGPMDSPRDSGSERESGGEGGRKVLREKSFRLSEKKTPLS
jgi:hypothetical protein